MIANLKEQIKRQEKMYKEKITQLLKDNSELNILANRNIMKYYDNY